MRPEATAVIDQHAPAAFPAVEQSAQQRRPFPRRTQHRHAGGVPLQLLLVGQVLLPRDISRQPALVEHMPLVARYEAPPDARLAGSPPAGIHLAAPEAVGPRIDRVVEHPRKLRAVGPTPLDLTWAGTVVRPDAQLDAMPDEVAQHGRHG